MLAGSIEGGVELGYVGVTAHAAEADRRTDDPCADPAQEHRAALPVLHVSREAADAAVQVLDRVGAAQRPVEGTPDAEALQSEGLDEALEQRAGRTGVVVLERARERTEAGLGDGRIVHLPGRAQDPSHARSHVFGQVVEDVALLVDLTALYHAERPEHVANGFAQRLGAVREAAPHHGRVLERRDEVEATAARLSSEDVDRPDAG